MVSLRRTCVTSAFSLLFPCLALAAEPTVWVGDKRMGVDENAVDCGAAIEGALRDLGYRSVAPDARTSATVQAEVFGACYPTEYGGVCIATALLTVRGRSMALEAKSQSGNSLGWAKGEVCRDLVEQVRTRVGAPRGGRTTADDSPGSATSKTRLKMTVQWKGEIQPMPLLKITTFLQKTGYNFKMLSSGSQECRFEISLDEPVESFASLLSTFLDAHYKAEVSGGKGKALKVRLSPR